MKNFNNCSKNCLQRTFSQTDLIHCRLWISITLTQFLLKVTLTHTPFVGMWETEWHVFRNLFFCWCQITSVALKLCCFSPLLYILTRDSLSLISSASLFLNFVGIRFCTEKSPLAICCMERQQQCNLPNFDEAGKLIAVVCCKKLPQLLHLIDWVMQWPDYCLRLSPLSSHFSLAYHREMVLALVDF